MKGYTIKQNNTVTQRTFRFVMQVQATFGEIDYENTTESLIQQTWKRKEAENDVFEIAVLEHKQTNDKDSHQWDKELNKIKNKLDFEVSAANGSLVKIINKKEIAEKWKNMSWTNTIG